VRLHAGIEFIHKLLVYIHQHVGHLIDQHFHYFYLNLKFNDPHVGYDDINLLQLHEHNLNHDNDYLVLIDIHGYADEY
jgi:hypothetical protein